MNASPIEFCSLPKGLPVGDPQLFAVTQQQLGALFSKLDKMGEDLHRLGIEFAKIGSLLGSLQPQVLELEKRLDWVQKQIYLAMGAGAVIGWGLSLWLRF